MNLGNIFRLLTKPCPGESLLEALAAGVRQYRLVMAERELLEKTLKGAIQVLGNVLSTLNPEAFGRTSRVTRYAREVAARMGETDLWLVETAATLSQVGCLILPGETLKKTCAGVKLTPREEELFLAHPSVAAEWIRKIPRLERVAEAVSLQQKNFDGSGLPADARRGEEIPPAARILKAVLDFDSLETAGHSKLKALEVLRTRRGAYDPRVLDALKAMVGAEAKYALRSVSVWELEENWILAEDVKTVKGLLLVTKGQEITPVLLERLKRFVALPGIQEPIKVIVPLREPVSSNPGAGTRGSERAASGASRPEP